ncbi:aminotransferase class I/II-fold pyridoxal phosphate-dependent enzyme [Compostibacter hankyongensis]|uniref:Methionine gamma-lyase n=1 Tax=Compostibacter hankyongensis TaxID=1007089 RepID=A0ABP8FFY0_9BACT
MDDQQHGFGSACIHGGHSADPRYAHLTPIYATSTYLFDTAQQGMDRFTGKEEGYIYARFGHPNATEAEQKIALLETLGLSGPDGQPLQAAALLHGSGMAALNTLFLAHLKAGDKILTHHSLYGGTDEVFRKILPGLGIEVLFADPEAPQSAAALLEQDPAIRLIYLETPTNPTLRCVDLQTWIGLGRQYGRLTAVDNTFATPYLQQPFRYGADFVFHSTTKYLNGHGTATGGILIGRDRDHMAQVVTKTYRLLGGGGSPFDAWLLSLGIKTLELRMERHCSNAMAVARFLEQQPEVGRVHYPGLAAHPDYQLAQQQMKMPGAMMSFELKGGLEAGKKFIDSLRLCVRAVSLGTCDTLVSHPASMTHYGVAKAEREAAGITDGLIRLSAGIENVEDIISDLEQALYQAKGER